MKLLFCVKCEDVVKMDYETRWCKCGHVSGRCLPEGGHVQVSPNAAVVGVEDSELLHAVRTEFYKNRPIDAWVFPSDHEKIHRIH